jgi:SAM-dependent methyltransferase
MHQNTEGGQRMTNRTGPRIVLLALFFTTGCSNWTGFGFRTSGAEMQRLRDVLHLKPGMSVADVGAGKGELTFALAAEVGSTGNVFSSEIDPDRLQHIRLAVADAKLDNVTVVEAQARDTSLPANCCDAIVLRRVYHHVTDPTETDASLLRAVRPGGVLAVIDFPPTLSWLWPWPPEGVPKNRGGHGVAAEIVVAEVTASGFQLVQVMSDWPGRGLLPSYCAVFRKPAAS